MNKKHLFILPILLAFFAFQMQTDSTGFVKNDCIAAGERIEYRVHYGFISAAEAIVETDSKIYTVNNRPCFRANITGRTVGMAKWFTQVNDTWQSWIDTTTFLPQQFYMNKKEGNYSTVDKYIFDHENDVVKSYELDDDHEKKIYKVPNNIQDVVSFSYLMRTYDFTKMQVGDVKGLKMFFEGDVYDVRVKYKGKEVVKTKYGKIQTLKLVPQLPKNNFFEDNEGLKIWVSDDANRIPIRIEVELKIGSLKMDFRGFSGLRNPIKFY